MMTTEFTELLLLLRDRKPQVWLLGNREEVHHMMNELCALRFAPDRAKFSPLIPIRSAPGTFMTILER